MDWNKNGKLDAADIFTTELFEEELKTMACRKHEKNEERKRDGNLGDNVSGGTKH